MLLHDRAGELLRALGQGELLRDHDRGAARAQPLWVPVNVERAGEAPMARAEIDWGAFYDRLRAYVAARVRDGAEVDDLVQRILERAVSKAAGAEIESTAGWLFGIARNAVADHYREQARSLLAVADGMEAADPMGSSDDERSAVLACMRPLLDALPQQMAQLLRWADMEGRPMQSIAGELGISLTAAKSRVQRARKDFVRLTSDCCAITLDARGRVTELTRREQSRAVGCAPCAVGCSGDDRTAS